jgi:hypothetical protein
LGRLLRRPLLRPSLLSRLLLCQGGAAEAQTQGRHEAERLKARETNRE